MSFTYPAVLFLLIIPALVLAWVRRLGGRGASLTDAGDSGHKTGAEFGSGLNGHSPGMETLKFNEQGN